MKRKAFGSTLVFLAVTLALVVGALFGFYGRIQKREYDLQMQSLRNIAVQGGNLAEVKLKGYFSTLEGMAEFLEEGPLYADENMRRLRAMAGREDVDFQRIGLADRNGNSRVSNGSWVNVADRNYFRKALQGERVISVVGSSRVTERDVFITAVPVRAADGTVRGVLYGAVETDTFQLSADGAALGHESMYIEIVDSKGDYVFRSEESRGSSGEETIFKRLQAVQSSVPVDEIRARLSRGEAVQTEVAGGGEKRVVYLAPLETGSWYLVTVMDQSVVSQRVQYLLGNDVYVLMAAVIGAVALLCAVIVRHLILEKRQIQEQFRQAELNDQLIRLAVSGGSANIIIYDVDRDRLRFVNHDNLLIRLPDALENASAALVDYLPESRETRQQVNDMFSRLRDMGERETFDLTLEIDRTPHSYRIHIRSLRDSAGRVVRCVGMVEDVTEKVRLSREVRFRERLLSGMMGFLVVDLTEDRVLRGTETLLAPYDRSVPFSRLVQQKAADTVPAEYRDFLCQRLSIQKLEEDFEAGQQDIVLEYPSYNKGRAVFWMECEIHLERDSSGHLIAYHTYRNIDDQKRRELSLREEAERDYLTGLYNRRSGTELIGRYLRGEKPEAGRTHAFVMLDLDNFKVLNDTLGHQNGDQALRDVAGILRQHFREYDVVCRLAGDEFVVFLKDIPTEVISRNVRSLLKKLRLTYASEGQQVEISASAGVAVAPEDGTTFNALYLKADQALYLAKQQGKQTFVSCRELPEHPGWETQETV